MSTEKTILEHPDLVIALTEGSARFTLDVYSKVDGPDGERPIDICIEIGEAEDLQAFSEGIGVFADAYSQENRGAVQLRKEVARLKAWDAELRAELKKPVARAWAQVCSFWERDAGPLLAVSVTAKGWRMRTKLRAHINKVEARCTCFMEGFSSSYATGRVRTRGGWDREIKRTARAAAGSSDG